jgi:hypothetical protein
MRAHAPTKARVVFGELAHVTRVSTRDFANMRGDRCGLTARVMRVVLDKAVDLPRRHTCGFQRTGKRVGRHVYKGHGAADRIGDGDSHFGVRHGRWPRDRVGLPFVPGFGQCASSDGSNVADVNRADARVADWRDEVPLRGDHRLECQETLEVQVRTEERETDAELADASLDRRVITKKTYG